jgi:hypothetical protein
VTLSIMPKATGSVNAGARHRLRRLEQDEGTVIPANRHPRESGDPVAFVQKTLDSLPAFAGTKGRGNDGITNAGVAHCSTLDPRRL